MLRGEDMETISRNAGVAAATLSQSRSAFLSAGEAALTSRPTSRGPLEAETLPTRLGETPLEWELLEDVKRL